MTMNDTLRSTLAVAALFAMTEATAPAQTPAPPPTPSYVTEKGFKSKVFEVKHRDPAALVDSVGPLASGFKGALVTANREMQTITVRDFPENVAAIEEALKRLDVQE